MSLSLLEHTHKSFCSQVRSLLGKGYQHAQLIYEEYFRKGSISGTHPAFNNAQELYQSLTAMLDMRLPAVVRQACDGGNAKLVIALDDGAAEVESVVIPMASGATLCVSSQVGCRMGCAFCETGRMGLVRNLTASEIVAQAFIARHTMGVKMRNIVFMGMGEPFDNYDNVMQAFRVLTDEHGMAIAPRHITISTSGCLDGIYKLMEEEGPKPHLAVSLNASNDSLRQKIMPVNRRHDMAEIHKAIGDYNRTTKDAVLVAYVLLKDINDTLDNAEELARYLQGLDVKVNLIPYNAQSNDRYGRPPQEIIDAFAASLRSHGYQVLVRQTRGDDIMAACGQLGNLQLRKKR